MPAILLVHGAWQSTNCWTDVISALGSLGKRAVAVTLTGLGGDIRHLTRQVRLSAHIDDVVRAIDSAGAPCFLVGHSYAGMVITGACEQRPAQVLGLVYAEAFIPESAQSALELLPQPVARMFQSIADEQGDGWRLAAGEFLLDVWGVRDPAHRAKILHDLSDFSMACFEQVLHLPFHHARNKPRGYIAGGLNHEYPARTVFERFTEEARTGGWLLVQLDSGHACEVEKPTEVATAISRFVDRVGGAR